MKKIFLFNFLGRKLEEFKPIKEGQVGIYSCGPTVYWYQHIGNLRTYILVDVLRKVLKYDGYKVKQIINITDVGHLTSDADEGEDKIEKEARKEGKKAEDIANYYFGVFDEDLKKLNISEPDIWCKATENIDSQIKLIKTLEKKGFTYRTSDGIYFDTSKFSRYGDYASLNIKGLKGGERIPLGEKRNKTDFALWKFSKIPGERQQEWDSPWGVGFPGWHIECSAMSMKNLGEHFDIHTGGIDHIPIHHTNEIAQSECATGKEFVNYWLEGNFLTNSKKKISKSKGGLYTLSDLEKLDFHPLVFRYFILTGHYRKPLDFSLDLLRVAKKSYERLKDLVSDLKDDGEINIKYLKSFEDAINKDLNMPEALAVLWNLIRDSKSKGKYRTIKEMEKIFSLDLFKRENIKIPKSIKELILEREKARKKKDWKSADEIRERVKEEGYVIEDVSGELKIKKIK